MRRGEIRAVNLDPCRGVITVVPVTSNIERIFPFQVLLTADRTGLPRDSKAQAEQVRSIPIERVGTRLGVLPPALLAQLDQALRLHLALQPPTRPRQTLLSLAAAVAGTAGAERGRTVESWRTVTA